MEWYTAAERFTEALASSDPTPGGGAAAAQAGAMGCALAMMAIGTTLKRKTISPDVKNRLEQSLKRLGALKNELKSYVQKDGEAYASYLTARKLPKENPSREEAIQNALLFAARVPSDAATTAVRALKETDTIKDDIAEVILSDVFCARHLLQACVRCAVESIRANLPYITHPDRIAELEKAVTIFLKSC